MILQSCDPHTKGVDGELSLELRTKLRHEGKKRLKSANRPLEYLRGRCSIGRPEKGRDGEEQEGDGDAVGGGTVVEEKGEEEKEEKEEKEEEKKEEDGEEEEEEEEKYGGDKYNGGLKTLFP